MLIWSTIDKRILGKIAQLSGDETIRGLNKVKGRIQVMLYWINCQDRLASWPIRQPKLLVEPVKFSPIESSRHCCLVTINFRDVTHKEVARLCWFDHPIVWQIVGDIKSKQDEDAQWEFSATLKHQSGVTTIVHGYGDIYKLFEEILRVVQTCDSVEDHNRYIKQKADRDIAKRKRERLYASRQGT